MCVTLGLATGLSNLTTLRVGFSNGSSQSITLCLSAWLSNFAAHGLSLSQGIRLTLCLSTGLSDLAAFWLCNCLSNGLSCASKLATWLSNLAALGLGLWVCDTLGLSAGLSDLSALGLRLCDTLYLSAGLSDLPALGFGLACLKVRG